MTERSEESRRAMQRSLRLLAALLAVALASLLVGLWLRG